jgi:autotransporter translocation and assembly factor TamB
LLDASIDAKRQKVEIARKAADVKAALDAEIARKAADVKAALDAKAADVKAALDAEIARKAADVKAALDAKAAEVKAALDAEVHRQNAKAAEVKAALDAEVHRQNAKAAEVKAALDAKVHRHNVKAAEVKAALDAEVHRLNMEIAIKVEARANNAAALDDEAKRREMARADEDLASKKCYRDKMLQIRQESTDAYCDFNHKKLKLIEMGCKSRMLTASLDLSPDEMRVFGTPAIPTFETIDVKPWMGRISMFECNDEPVTKTVMKVVAALSESHDIWMGHRKQRTSDFIPCTALDHLLTCVGNPLGVSEADVNVHFRSITQHEAMADPCRVAERDWGVRPPKAMLAASTSLGDDADEKEDPDKDTLEFHQNLNALMRKLLDEVDELKSRLTDQEMCRAKCDLVRAIARTRNVVDRVNATGVYMSDALARADKDLFAKAHNLTNVRVQPMHVLWERTFGSVRNIGFCETCKKTISIDDGVERGHIVPSRGGKFGSNGKHNIIIMCRACNTACGDVDALRFAAHIATHARA